MKKNDPDNLRKPALQLLSELLPDGTLAGVWTFGRYVNMQVKWGIVDEQWKRAARSGASALHSHGLFTNIEGAIDRATQDWHKLDSRYRRSLILLTDGVVDISKNPAENASSRQRILTEQLARLSSLDVKIYTVALSDDSDVELLKLLANQTGGWYEMAETADRLLRIFLRTFEKTVQADTLPLTENKFAVDSSIDELTLLVFKPEGGDPVQLLLPGAGSAISARENTAGFNWIDDSTHELITIVKPRQGEWKIIGDADPDNRVMVVTDLRLRVDGLPSQALPGNELLVTASLQQAGETITRSDFLDLISVQLTIGSLQSVKTYNLRDDGQSGDSMAGDGLYTIQIAPLGEGEHTLEFNVDGGTFARAHRHELEVQWPVTVELQTNRQGNEGLHQLLIKPREGGIDPKNLLLEVSLRNADDSTTALEPRINDAGDWVVSIDTQDRVADSSVTIKIKGRSESGDSIDHIFPPMVVPGGATAKLPIVEVASPSPSPSPLPMPMPPPPPTAEINWLLIASIGGMGLLLSLMGGIGWKILSIRKIEKIQNSTEDGDSIIDGTEEIEEIVAVEVVEQVDQIEEFDEFDEFEVIGEIGEIGEVEDFDDFEVIAEVMDIESNDTLQDKSDEPAPVNEANSELETRVPPKQANG
jgi:uncharacterized protein (TIGR03503 family)